MRGEGRVEGYQPMSRALHRSPNKLWISNSIFYPIWVRHKLKLNRRCTSYCMNGRPPSPLFQNPKFPVLNKVFRSADTSPMIHEQSNVIEYVEYSIYVKVPSLAVSCIQFKQSKITPETGIYTVKKVSDFPVPSRDVTNQTLPGRPGKIVLYPARESLVSDIPAGAGNS